MVEIREQKIDTYTDSKKFAIWISGEKFLSGNTREEALIATLKYLYNYGQRYRNQVIKLNKAISPLVEYLESEED